MPGVRKEYDSLSKSHVVSLFQLSALRTDPKMTSFACPPITVCWRQGGRERLAMERCRAQPCVALRGAVDSCVPPSFAARAPHSWWQCTKIGLDRLDAQLRCRNVRLKRGCLHTAKVRCRLDDYNVEQEMRREESTVSGDTQPPSCKTRVFEHGTLSRGDQRFWLEWNLSVDGPMTLRHDGRQDRPAQCSWPFALPCAHAPQRQRRSEASSVT